MSKSLNKVQLIGHLGADPEVRFTQDGRAIAGLRIATSDSWTDKQGQKQERTEWHSVSIFGKLAEIAQHYLRKGSKVFLEGQLQTDKYTDKQGIERYSTKIVLTPYNGQMILLDRAPGTAGEMGAVPAYAGPAQGSYGSSAGYGGAGYAAAPLGAAVASNQASGVRGASAPGAGHAAEHPFDHTPDFDDDIPF
ncbi:single-stranded DNA-binding protein [Candidatus Magnetaquicoccus inordinatus]|uniref:single-stranded DNA-binding protein n=1 Tax=Candidatus Magnetaquicoccus inordinatus TaxID=2496818 RepID=UPI001D0E0415|nr:single-stranded DNA-binding protein [Candidatus Magnetaquicoccus inordinatus]